MAGGVTIRPARAGDAEGIARVHVRTWHVAYEHILGREALAGLTVEGRRRGWEVVGLVGGGPPRDRDLDPARTAELYAIYLAPERWGGGIASALMDALLERLAEGGAQEAALWVLEGNGRARRFYERAGWRPDGAAKSGQHLGVSVREMRYRAPCGSA